jgi:hypothetical protein
VLIVGQEKFEELFFFFCWVCVEVREWEGDKRGTYGFWGTMNGGSLGMRSGSYGSLDKQLQQNNNNNNSNNNYNGVSPIPTVRKPSKMQKEKERLFHWICKFAGRKRVGMLLLCVISAVVFVWVLYVGKGLVFHSLSLSLSLSFCCRYWVIVLNDS